MNSLKLVKFSEIPDGTEFYMRYNCGNILIKSPPDGKRMSQGGLLNAQLKNSWGRARVPDDAEIWVEQ